jgi:phosphoribosylcarboxyaminoimidazole (NCAIR) mutase
MTSHTTQKPVTGVQVMTSKFKGIDSGAGLRELAEAVLVSDEGHLGILNDNSGGCFATRRP